MNIMFEDSITDEVKSKYMLLELDTFYFSDIDRTKTAYCLIESAPIQEMFNIEKSIELHNNLIKNYKLRNWKYCQDALEHLMGRWNKELDSFYKEILLRVISFQEIEPGPDWTATIKQNV